MDLREAAEKGNVSAIEQYANSLIQEKNWTSASEWFLKGAQLGSYYCMIQYAQLTIMLTEARINIVSDTVDQGITDLLEAEEWANKAFRAGRLENDQVLYGATGIYAEMTWCYYVRGVKTKDTNYYIEVEKYFEKIKGKPQSREMYAYMMALDSLGEAKKSFDVAMVLHDDHDDTLKPFMQEVVCGHLSQAFLEGKVTQPSYDSAYTYAQEAYNINPQENEQLLDFYRSGDARREYESLHNVRNEKGNQDFINKPSAKVFISIGIVAVLLFSGLGIVIYNHSKTVSEPSIDIPHFLDSDDDTSTTNEASNVSLVDSSFESNDSNDDIAEEDENASGDIDTVYRIDKWVHDQMNSTFEEYTDDEQIIAYVDDGELVRVDAFPDDSYSLYRSFFYDNGELTAAVYSDEDDTENHVFYLEDGSLICIATWDYDLEQYENSFSEDEWGKWPGYLYSHSDQYWEAARQLVDEEENSDEKDISDEEDINDSDFVLPNSSSEYLSMDDLDGLMKNECRIARNEVYARHGRIFKDEGLRDYFNQFDWYEPTIDPDDFNDDSILSDVEKKNLDLITDYEQIQGYR